MNMVLERLDVTKNYVTIDSPIAFYIQVNDDVENRVLKSPQAIQIDCRKLLSHFYMPNEPAWKVSLVYDKDLLSENESVKWSAHNVDFAGSTNSVDGELVKVDLTTLYTHLQDNNTEVNNNIDSVEDKVTLTNGKLDNLNGNLSNILPFLQTQFQGKILEPNLNTKYYINGNFLIKTSQDTMHYPYGCLMVTPENGQGRIKLYGFYYYSKFDFTTFAQNCYKDIGWANTNEFYYVNPIKYIV